MITLVDFFRLLTLVTHNFAAPQSTDTYSTSIKSSKLSCQHTFLLKIVAASVGHEFFIQGTLTFIVHILWSVYRSAVPMTWRLPGNWTKNVPYLIRCVSNYIFVYTNINLFQHLSLRIFHKLSDNWMIKENKKPLDWSS